MTLVVIAEIVAGPGHEAAIREVARGVATHAREHEHGCLQYDVFEDHARPGRFLTFERWTDDAALDAHIAAADAAPGVDAIYAMLAEPLKVTRLAEI